MKPKIPIRLAIRLRILDTLVVESVSDKGVRVIADSFYCDEAK